MAKKVALLAVNPVNGFGLFQYLETFFENGIPYKTFAVADTPHIRTNSGISITVDGVIADLKGHEADYDALVFACGDAVPQFAENSDKPYNRDMMTVIKTFADRGKILVGHCGAAMIFEAAGVGGGKKMAIHPYAKPTAKNIVATDDKYNVDGGFYTAQTEDTIWTMMPELLKALE